MDHQPATGRIRASDHDRTTTIERLGDALAEGALDTTEYNRRLGHALTATTHDDLDRLTTDLPASHAAKADADKRAWLDEWSYWIGGAAIMTAIWAVSALRAGEWTFFWPVAPLGIWAAVLISYAIRPSHHDH